MKIKSLKRIKWMVRITAARKYSSNKKEGANVKPISLYWSLHIALILVFQSLVSIIFCVPSALCFWIAAREDNANNIKKFGVDYEEYMKKVPIWNVFKSLRKLK